MPHRSGWPKVLFVIVFILFVSFKEEDENQLQREYENMLAGLRKASEENDADLVLANPILPEDVLKGKNATFLSTPI